MTAAPRSLLHVVKVADNFPAHGGLYPAFHPKTKERYVPFHLTYSDYASGLTPVGLLRPAVIDQLAQDREARIDDGPFQIAFSERSSTRMNKPEAGDNEDEDEDMVSDVQADCVWFADEVVRGGKDGMSRAMQETAERWRSEGKFEGPLAGTFRSARQVDAKLNRESRTCRGGADRAGWRNEHYMIYADPQSSALQMYDASKPFSNAAFELERAACAIFGLATFGVHMTGEAESWEGGGAE